MFSEPCIKYAHNSFPKIGLSPTNTPASSPRSLSPTIRSPIRGPISSPPTNSVKRPRPESGLEEESEKQETPLSGADEKFIEAHTLAMKNYGYLFATEDEAQTMHEVYLDEGDGTNGTNDSRVLRWKPDPLIRLLVDRGLLDLTHVAVKLRDRPEIQREIARKIGYSLAGYSDLSYVSLLYGSDVSDEEEE